MDIASSVGKIQVLPSDVIGRIAAGDAPRSSLLVELGEDVVADRAVGVDILDVV